MDIQKLIKEDNLNFGNKQFKKYIIEKYNLSDNYFDKLIYRTYYPIREVYVYSFQKDGTRRIIEHAGFIEYDDTDTADRVHICLMDNRPNSRYHIKHLYSIAADNLENFYKLHHIVINLQFYSLNKLSNEEARTVFVTTQKDKLKDLEDKFMEQKKILDLIPDLQIEHIKRNNV